MLDNHMLDNGTVASEAPSSAVENAEGVCA
jgi:hypothetical protein